MKQFLVILAFLTGGLSQVYGQLPYPEMKLTASSGQSHGYANASAQIGTFVDPNGNIDTDWDDIVLLPMDDSDVNKVYYDLHVEGNKNLAAGAAYSDTYANLDFSCTQIGTSYTTSPHIMLFSEHYQNSGVSTVVGTTIQRASGQAITAGKYSMTVAPNNPGTWGATQKVPARMIVDLMPIETTPGGGVIWSRDLVYHVEVKWGGSYLKATWDNEESSWAVEVKSRQNPGGEYTTDIWWTDPEEDGMSLNLNITSYEAVASNGSVVGEVIVSNTPTTFGINLPPVLNLHQTEQTIANYLGTGSGSGNIAAYFSGQVKLIPDIKLKK